MKSICILTSISSVYGVTKRTGYYGYVPKGGAEGMMRQRWLVIGNRINNAINHVGESASVQEKNEGSSTDEKQAAYNNKK